MAPQVRLKEPVSSPVLTRRDGLFQDSDELHPVARLLLLLKPPPPLFPQSGSITANDPEPCLRQPRGGFGWARFGSIGTYSDVVRNVNGRSSQKRRPFARERSARFSHAEGYHALTQVRRHDAFFNCGIIRRDGSPTATCCWGGRIAQQNRYMDLPSPWSSE